jgi:hypothetical protein
VDFVRVEVESALRFAKHVIPVLVQKTEMPRADALPESLKALARRNAVGLTHERFKPDVQGLIKVLEDALTEMEEARRRVANAAAASAEKLTTERAAKVEEVTRAIGEWVKLHAIAVPSPEQIAKAEELANWDFIKASESIEGFRDHLARFPQGVSDRWARVGLERLVWAGLPRRIDRDALNGFLAEFPNGAHAGEASRMRVQTRLIRVFAGHSDRVNSVAFSPNGCSALSGSSDDTLKLWEDGKGEPHIRRPLQNGQFGRVLARWRKRGVQQLGQHAQVMGRRNRKGDRNIHWA